MKEETQQEFLRAGKALLDVAWDRFAELADVHPRAFKTYRMPSGSSEYREMNKFVREAVERVLLQHRARARRRS